MQGDEAREVGEIHLDQIVVLQVQLIELEQAGERVALQTLGDWPARCRET